MIVIVGMFFMIAQPQPECDLASYLTVTGYCKSERENNLPLEGQSQWSYR